MSVHTGIQAAHRTDSHGHCPQNRLTCANQQAEPCAPKAHPARANVRRGKAEEPLADGGYHPVPGIPGLRTVIPAPVTTMIAAPGAPLLAAEARHDEVRNPPHYPPTPDTRTPQADGAPRHLPSQHDSNLPAELVTLIPAMYPGGTWHPPSVDLRRPCTAQILD